MDFNARVRYIPRHEKFVFSSQAIKLGAFISDVYFKFNLHSDRVALICILNLLSPNSDEKEISLYTITACSHSSNENKGNNHHG